MSFHNERQWRSIIRIAAVLFRLNPFNPIQQRLEGLLFRAFSGSNRCNLFI